MKLNLAGFILCLIIIVLVVVLNSCTTSRSGCGTERDVRRHDSKPFRVMILKEGTIAQANEYRRTTLVKVVRTMKGYRHLFVSDDGDSATLYLYPALTQDSCYLVKTVNFS